MAISPMLLEIVEGALESAMREIEIQVERTARSTNIREANDHVPAIFDARGRSIASVSFTANVDPILNRWRPDDVRPGDVFVWNHPYQSDGGIGHLPDICLNLPVFHDGQIVAFVQEMGHVQDVGGMVVGSMPQNATELFQEGFIIPPVKLVDAGTMNQALYTTILANTRFPDDLEGDIDAMLGGCRIGVERLQWLCQRYGVDVLNACFDALVDRCERTLVSEVFPQIPDGSYTFDDFVEYVDVVPAEPRKFIRITLTMHKTPDRIIFDFDGTDRQVIGSINFPADERFYARGLVTTFKSFVPDLLVNDGVLRVVEVRLPKGTVLSPEYPAACGYRHYPLLRCFGVALGVLAKAMRGNVPMGADNMSGVSLSGIHPNTGQPWYMSMPLGGGSSGRPFADGSDTVLATPGRNVPAEYAETFYPFRVLQWGLNPDSGGAGLHRGGLGYRLLLEFDATTRVRVRTDRHYLQPAGVNGGLAALTAQFVFNPGTDREHSLPGKCDDGVAQTGDRLLITSPGGGGWGNPLDRDPDLVDLDVLRGLVSAESAFDHYGVVSGDLFATAQRRDDLRHQRGRLPMIDRGSLFAARLAAGDLALTVADDGWVA